jgi:hypothetical protein
MKSLFVLPALAIALSAHAQDASHPTNPFQSLSFLIGTWEAKTAASNGITASGTYVFQLELKNHILARHTTSNSAACHLF